MSCSLYSIAILFVSLTSSKITYKVRIKEISQHSKYNSLFCLVSNKKQTHNFFIWIYFGFSTRIYNSMIIFHYHVVNNFINTHNSNLLTNRKSIFRMSTTVHTSIYWLVVTRPFMKP